ncbi:MAG: ferrous iron transport protein B, partial [Candidatus Adiutrix sp.]
VIATTGDGVLELLDKAIELASGPQTNCQPLEISYGLDIDEAIGSICQEVKLSALPVEQMPPRWLTIKYLEGDPKVLELFQQIPQIAKIEEIKRGLAAHLQITLGDEIEGAMTDRRYGFLAGLCRVAVLRLNKHSRDLSDTIDRVLLNRLLAPFFFLLIIYGLYKFTFWASAPVVFLLETMFATLSQTLMAHMSDGLLKDLILEGLIGGVGGVLGFVPLIAFMFVGISILEDSGYMARVAFILDRLFRAFGLHGNSVVAMIIGGGIAGGCAIPGVMATRTLRDPKERIATILITPFMACGAKLPVFLMLAAAFFNENEALVMMGLTLFAWATALISAKIIRTTLLPGDPAPFVLELPPYRRPTLGGVLLHSWERTWSYIKKAGTVIVGVAVIIWLMMTFPQLPPEQKAFYENQAQVLALELDLASSAAWPQADIQVIEDKITDAYAFASSAGLRHSIAGRIGLALEPLSRLIGFDWRTNIALVGGFAAKEVVLSTLGTAYAIDDKGIGAMGEGVDGQLSADELNDFDDEIFLIQSLGLRLSLDPNWSALAAVSLMIFVLIYAPCFATIVVIFREIGAFWAAFSLIGSTVYAYLICLVIYQGGKFLGLGL